ncbi:hypothetical protein LWC05_16550, partial [Acetobacter sicerae]
MSVSMFDLDGADGQPSFEQMFGLVRPVLDRVIEDMRAQGRFSIQNMMEATLLSCNETVAAYNRVAVKPDHQELLELSGACLLTAANAMWMGF